MLEHRIEDVPPVGGSFGLAQGVYGSAGNLELLVPGRGGGMHVLWYNADTPAATGASVAGAAARRWSGALHVPAADDGGALVHAARITQVRNGPNLLEAAALVGTTARRLYWTPADGFVRSDVLATDAVGVSAIVEASDGQLHALVVTSGGTLLHCRAEPAGYPAVRWRTAAIEVGDPADGVELLAADDVVRAVVRFGSALRVLAWREGWHPETTLAEEWLRSGPVAGTASVVVGMDPRRRVQLTFRDGGWSAPTRPWPQLAVDDVAAAATTLDGGRLDLVLRTGDGLQHAWSIDGGAAWTEPQLIRSDVWVAPGAPVHRR
jgi:hypothetical protein